MHQKIIGVIRAMNEIITYVNGNRKEVTIVDNSKIFIDGKENTYELIALDSNSFLFNFNKKIYKISSGSKIGSEFSILVDGISFTVTANTPLEEKANAILAQHIVTKHKTDIKAPMPGMILKIKKKPGDSIDHGETLIILEAMKMENDLRSPATGIIKEIFINEGSKVEKGSLLLSIE